MTDWEKLEQSIKQCNKCELSKTRNNVVVGRGNEKAPIMFIGEGPGEQEDQTGDAFVGRAGKLLDLLLEALMFEKDSYYIANIVKCRPPNNRVPIEEEAIACLPYLREQVRLIKPKILVCLGSTAAKYILKDKNIKISQIRGQWINKDGFFDIMPTFHPAALLRNESYKDLMFSDLKMVKNKLKTIS